MTEPRRYDEEEIAEILRRAAQQGEEDSLSPPARRSGLTLGEIATIAGEVGIDPARIERAARELEPERVAPRVTWLGAPRSVTRIEPLDRPLDDDEWTRLVVLLRETFGAMGEVDETGPIRTWHNGNLEVHVEPGPEGHRLRMRTLKGELDAVASVAVSVLIVALIMAVGILGKRGLDPALFISAIFAAGGIGMLANTRLRLPGWAAEREAQMDEIAHRVHGLMRRPAPEGSLPAESPDQTLP